MKLIWLPAMSLLYILLISTIYFSKKRVDSLENKIYKYMMIANIFGLIIEIFCFYMVSNLKEFPILNCIVTKLLLVYYLLWLLLFTFYIISISFSNINNISNIIKQKIIYFFIGFFVINSIILFILPLEYYSNNSYSYSYGAGVNYLVLISSFLFILWPYCLIKNKTNALNKKYIPLFTFMFLGIITVVIQRIYPYIVLQTALESFITILMYFTIENPDMKMIEQLNIAKDQAEQANKAKTDFLSNMSHEIRTPLNAIVGFSEILETENIPDSSKELVNDIMVASESLVEIVNGVLDISKIEANKLEIVNTEYEFKKLFDEMVLLAKGRLGDKPLQFNYYCDASIPNYLYGDSARVKQVGINLLTNAIKYTKEGEINFRVNSVVTKDICRLVMIVEDTGIGIKKENIDKLFTKFERLGVEKNTTVEGTGLGLAICKKLVELMGGKILVQSIYGEGSKFTVVLDQKIVVGKHPIVEEKVESNIIDIKDKNVLVVDDNELNIKVACRLLNIYNVKTDSAMSGMEAIDKIKNNKYDLILLDDMMPKMSGTDTLKELKEMPDFKTPVVVLTANAISGMREKYLSLGFDDYLSKPIEKLELSRVIKKYLS